MYFNPISIEMVHVRLCSSHYVEVKGSAVLLKYSLSIVFTSVQWGVRGET